MSDTTFVDGTTVIVASWLNDVNDYTYGAVVTPGAYTSTNLTVDATGKITAIANGSGGGGLTPPADINIVSPPGVGYVANYVYYTSEVPAITEGTSVYLQAQPSVSEEYQDDIGGSEAALLGAEQGVSGGGKVYAGSGSTYFGASGGAGVLGGNSTDDTTSGGSVTLIGGNGLTGGSVFISAGVGASSADDGSVFISGRGMFIPVLPGASTVSAMWNGDGVPSDAEGNDGDFYFRNDGTSGTLLYHKAAGSWSAFA